MPKSIFDFSGAPPPADFFQSPSGPLSSRVQESVGQAVVPPNDRTVDKVQDQGAPTSSNLSEAATGATANEERVEWMVVQPEDLKLQVIDEDQNFSTKLLEAISTLLNRLFGTNFDVMPEGEGPKRTTEGIWLSKAKDTNVLVMDVEGTDGHERGDDVGFQRKSAIVSLAIVEVVIVNLPENMVGLHAAANMPLLQTVLEVNLKLFHEGR
ncbi:root hair defective 3 GTP-binding protein-domain-containing protein [Blyttiomyces helicus]|uniref:Root hair defective 3 GTP-binding protein-domain-containing protein n=1 Tax=Blyttiomyces helicus TaxID=388810 RepID=A0A4P9W8T0_9FUNG|nr:root hair defective 3 GTP-binding protein-domain-containing protein [Blyttiomyces helicus]|eukprot:RKO88542.1 root hair defective 3 GTP-binding protein-domain-containing protein [Blyttiomyces helicus]